MAFSHLFIFQLRSWPCGLGSPHSDSGPDLFDLLILDLLIFDYLLFQLLHPLAFHARADTPYCADLAR